MSTTPEPAYSVQPPPGGDAPAQTETELGTIELRRYEPMVVAEVRVEGERDRAINQGFRILFDYIQGENRPAESIPMTAPVTQQPNEDAAGESIPMTAPVTQQPAAGESSRDPDNAGDFDAEQRSWTVAFIMPPGRTLDDLPQPADERVSLREIPAHRALALQFSGYADREEIAERANALRDFAEAQGLAPDGAPTYAGYNPPWTLPWFRRNEVLLKLED